MNLEPSRKRLVAPEEAERIDRRLAAEQRLEALLRASDERDALEREIAAETGRSAAEQARKYYADLKARREQAVAQSLAQRSPSPHFAPQPKDGQE